MDDFIKKFIEEASDLINALESSILSLEQNPKDEEIINEVFRIMHSLKGGGAMFGFDKISDFTHNMENIYDEIRNKKKNITKELLDITLNSVDHLRNLLDPKIAEKPETIEIHKTLSEKINKILDQKDDNAGDESKTYEQDTTTKKLNTYYIYFKPNIDIFDNGTNPLYTIEDLYELGECVVFAKIETLPYLGKFDYTDCYIYWQIILQTSKSISEIEGIFMFVEDDCVLEIKKISENQLLDINIFVNSIIDINDFDFNELKDISQSYTAEKKDDKLVENVFEKIKKFTKESEITSIRIATEKIDEYMNLVSELVTAQASLKLYSENNKHPELDLITENIETITDQIRENAFNISLIPVENVVVRFRRLVRDLSKTFNKNIEFITEGTDTRIDKTILQTITEPLMHIIRNSIDHGIETEEERIATGKSRTGKITLKAYHSGSNVHIEVEDDGKGIDIEKVAQKAKQKKLIAPDAIITEKEVKQLVFMPGFSTTDRVSDISGRGVGMDVLRRKIADTRGEIDLSFKKNKGTRIILKIPLTLSIIDGLLVSLEDSLFVVPLTSISIIRDITLSKLKKSKKNVTIVDNKQIPFYFLREEFEIEGEYPENLKLICVKYQNTKIGLIFDRIMGEYQTVLKSLGKMYRKHEIVSGATILGDGTVALVLDTNKIITKFSQAQEAKLN